VDDDVGTWSTGQELSGLVPLVRVTMADL